MGWVFGSVFIRFRRGTIKKICSIISWIINVGFKDKEKFNRLRVVNRVSEVSWFFGYNKINECMLVIDLRGVVLSIIFKYVVFWIRGFYFFCWD